MIELLGYVDLIREKEVAGWAKWKDRDVPVLVCLLINEERASTQEAHLFRKDLKEKGIHPTGSCGFRFNLQEGILEGSQVRVVGLYDDQIIPLSGDPEPSSFSKKRKIFFMHIPKTAGYSMNDLISGYFLEGKVTTHLETKNWRNQDNWLTSDYISGHVPFHSLSQRVPLKDYFKITLLRDPIAQVISHISMVRRLSDPDNQGGWNTHSPAIQDLSLRLKAIDFTDYRAIVTFVQQLKGQANVLFNNCQTRYFLSQPNTPVFTSDHLEEALQTLSEFDLIGIVEKIEAFFSSLSTLMNWPPGKVMPRHNVGTKKFGMDASDPVLREILHPVVEYDQLLYEEVKMRSEQFGIQ